MTSRFEFEGKGGKKVTIEVTYVCEMVDRVIDADGFKISSGRELSTYGSRLTTYIDGVKLDESSDPTFWALIDTKMGKRIWGSKLGFADAEMAAKYEAWINAIIESGKPEELKAAETAEAEAKAEQEIEYAKRIVAEAEKQKDIPSAAEARRRMKVYNDAVNEGGYGYVPYIVSLEEYEAAKQVLAKA